MVQNLKNRMGINDIELILKEVKKRLHKIYGKRLKSIILYGSYARGDATEDSDIDLILLLKNMKNPYDEIITSSKALGNLELIHDTLISILPLEEKEFNSKSLPIILNAKKEGIRI